MKKIAVFSGNRAEFGILYPLIKELSDEYQIEVILSGAHVLKRWNTQKSVQELLQQEKMTCDVYLIEVTETEDTYRTCFGEIKIVMQLLY